MYIYTYTHVHIHDDILWCGCLTNHDIESSFALEDDEYQLVGQRTPMISAVASTTLALTKKLFKFEHGP